MTCFAVVMFLTLSFAQDDDESLIEYPDRSYGIDLGDDWQVMPDGGELKFVGDQATRGDYVDTADYGPITRKGLEIFPEFYWRGPTAQAAKKAEAAQTYLIYYEATTVPQTLPEDLSAEGARATEKIREEVESEKPEKKDKEEEATGGWYIGTGESGAGDH